MPLCFSPWDIPVGLTMRCCVLTFALRLHVAILSLVLLLSTSCRTRSNEGAVRDVAAPAADLPNEGQSLFRHLVARAPNGKVPYPFKALLDYVGTYAIETRVAAIPFGRSLQKKAAAPEFLARPRLVAAFAGGNWSTINDFVPVASNVYFGHVPGTSQIEVISWHQWRVGCD